jgi:hypothetical protein
MWSSNESISVKEFLMVGGTQFTASAATEGVQKPLEG